MKMIGDTIPKTRNLAGYEHFWDETTARSYCWKLDMVRDLLGSKKSLG